MTSQQKSEIQYPVSMRRQVRMRFLWTILVLFTACSSGDNASAPQGGGNVPGSPQVTNQVPPPSSEPNSEWPWINSEGVRDFMGRVATSLNGNVAVVGGRLLNLTGVAGSEIQYVRQFDKYGRSLWKSEYVIGAVQRTQGLAFDKFGNLIWVSYAVSDFGSDKIGSAACAARLTKFSPTGVQLWGRLLTGAAATCTSAFDVEIDMDGTSFYVVGNTDSALFGQAGSKSGAGFIAKYDGEGNLAWGQLVSSTNNLQLRAVTVSSRNDISVCGYYNGDIGKGNWDTYNIFVSQFDSTGTKRWFASIESNGEKFAYDCVGAENHSVYVVGTTFGSFSGEKLNGDSDAFILNLESTGPTWVRFFGGSGRDTFESVVKHGPGTTTIAAIGATQGALVGDGTRAADCSFGVLGVGLLPDGRITFTKTFGNDGKFPQPPGGCSPSISGWGIGVGKNDYLFVAGETNFNIFGRILSQTPSAFILRAKMNGEIF